jgi:hypothetical protein
VLIFYKLAKTSAMKKTYILLVFFFLASTVKSQTPYYKMLPTDTVVWQHFDCYIAVKTSQPMYWGGANTFAAIDTISFSGLKYKKIYDLNTNGISYSWKTLSGYMREDTLARKVYYKQNAGSPEQLIYDFSRNVGDSIQLSFTSVNYNGYYRLDSVVIRNERCGPRRHFYYRKHLNNTNPAYEYLDHVESIGATFHAFYFSNYLLNYGCQFNFGNNNCKWPGWSMGISCKYNNLKKQYQSCTYTLAQMNMCLNPVDSCNYHNYCGGLKTSSYNSQVSVSPNPVNDFLKIESEGLKGTIIVKVTDIMGREIFSEVKQEISVGEMQINTQSLVNGIYFIRIEHENGFFVREFVVSH